MFTAFISLFFGIGGFFISFLWQWLGATPCYLCILERWTFLEAGLFATPVLFISSTLWQQRLLAISGASWLGLMIILAYHMGIQFKWFSLPHYCQSAVPLEGNPLDILVYLTQKPQTTCDAIEFTFLGLPPTFYMLILSSFLTVLCFITFFKNFSSKPSNKHT